MPADLAILISAQETATKVFDHVADKGGVLGSALKVGALAGGGALIGLGAVALKIGGDFDEAFDAIRVGTGATGDTLKGLQGDFKAVISDVPTDFATASEAIAGLNQRLGVTGKPLQELATQMINLSRITGTDIKTNVADATRLFGDWSIATEDQAGALDHVFKTTQATGIPIGNLMEKMVQFGAPLRQMGFGFEESAALMGKWEKEGVNSELVLGSLRIAMGHFAKENIPMREGLDATIAKIRELGPGAEATTLAMETFGARAGPDMGAAILEGRFAVSELLDTIKGSSETINKAAGDTDDFAQSWTKFKNKALVAIEPVVSGIFSLTSAVLDGATSGNWDALQAVVEETFGAEAAKKVLGLTEAVVEGLSKMRAAIEEHAPETFEAMRPALNELIEFVGSGVSEIVAFWVDEMPQIQEAVENLTKGIRALWDQFGSDIIAVIKLQWDIIRTVIEGSIRVIGDIIKIVLSLINGDWSAAWDAAKDIVTTVMNTIKTVFEDQVKIVLTILRALGGAAKDALGPLGEMLVDAGKDLVQGFINGIKSMAGDVKDAAKDIGKDAIDAVKFWGKSPWPEMDEAGQDAGQGFVDGLRKKKKEIVAAVTEWHDAAMDETKTFDFWGWFAGAGHALPAWLQEPIEPPGDVVAMAGTDFWDWWKSKGWELPAWISEPESMPADVEAVAGFDFWDWWKGQGWELPVWLREPEAPPPNIAAMGAGFDFWDWWKSKGWELPAWLQVPTAPPAGTTGPPATVFTPAAVFTGPTAGQPGQPTSSGGGVFTQNSVVPVPASIPGSIDDFWTKWEMLRAAGGLGLAGPGSRASKALGDTMPGEDKGQQVSILERILNVLLVIAGQGAGTDPLQLAAAVAGGMGHNGMFDVAL